MNAAVLTDVGAIEVQKRDRPEPRAKEVLVEVGACGVCTTDYHMYHGTFAVDPPRILGHESAGTVAQTGADVGGVAVGDRVAINPTIPCNHCSYCKRGQTHLCENNTSLGGAGERVLDGAFAEYVRVPATNIEPIGDLDFRTAAFAEPLACSLHGVGRAGVGQGDSVALLGAGPIGLLLLQVLRNRGAAPIVVSEPDDQRRQLAADLGADVTVDPDAVEDVREAITDVAGPVEAAIEAVGTVDLIQQAFDVTASGGTTLIFGVPDTDVTLEISPYDIFFTERDVHGSYSLTQADFERAVTLLSTERIDVDPLVTAEFDLAGLTQAFDRMDRREGLKNLVRP
ncbi:alcohol dehydrogenase catalytic domain-containing protein [Halorhabdus amylolytica]|uniref:alcohol dehydrogenase catalytic domain-containing protein n=1 Tax=Halorhabdus amylolytica TaxID=2559573 RepID=UPI0010AA7A29